MRLLSNYFHHLLSLGAHIDSRTDSQALRLESSTVLGALYVLQCHAQVPPP